MPLYAIIGYDTPDSAQKRQIHRPAHIKRLQDLHAQNRLIVAGPTPVAHGQDAMSGSVVIAEFSDDAALQQWLDDEPYLLGGVYSHVEARPFIQALPKM